MSKLNVALVSLALSSVVGGVSANTGLNTTEVLHQYGGNNSTGSTLTNGTAYDVDRTVYMDASTVGQPYEDRHCVTCDAENEYNTTHTSAKNIANVTEEGAWAPDFLNTNVNENDEEWEPAFFKDIIGREAKNGEEETLLPKTTSYTASTLRDSVGSSVNIPAGELYSDESIKLFESIQYIKYRGTSNNSTTFNINSDKDLHLENKDVENKKKELLNSEYYLNQEDIVLENQEEVEEPTMREKIITTLSSILLPYAFFMNRNSLTLW